MVQVDKKICPHDHICPLIKICPVGAISQDSEGFPVIDYNLCIECGKCVRKCPMKAMKKVENKTGNTNFIKIALPVKDGMIDNHFGHCENFAISSISDGQIESVEIMSVQEDCKCKSELASILHSKGVEIILATNMGENAKLKLENQGLKVICGCTGKVETVIRDYINGTIKDSRRTCTGNHERSHHGHGHGHSID